LIQDIKYVLYASKKPDLMFQFYARNLNE
jgi:hypothetical protein